MKKNAKETNAWKKILTLSFSMVLALLLAELGLRIIRPSSPFSPRLALRPYQRIEMVVSLPGISTHGLQSTNKWGLRGDAPPADWDEWITFIAVGGSTTHCFYLDDSRTWTALLQDSLRCHEERTWVGNGGIDGHSSRGHLLFMQDVVEKLRPDALLFLVGINDLARALVNDKGRRHVHAERVNNNWKDLLFNYSHLAQIAYVFKQIWLEDAKVMPRSRHDSYTPVPLDSTAVLPASRLDSLLARGLEEYTANLQQLIHLGKSFGVKMVFMTQPMLFGSDPRWDNIKGEFFWFTPEGEISAADYWRGLDLYNSKMIEVCSENNIPCLDLARGFPHDEKYFYDAVHFTEAGAALVAQKIAEFLLEQDVLQTLSSPR